jgi:hypothetical protein
MSGNRKLPARGLQIADEVFPHVQCGQGEHDETERHDEAVPPKFSNALLQDTATVCSEWGERQVSGEDAREMLESLTGFFETLIEWGSASKQGGTRGTK